MLSWVVLVTTSLGVVAAAKSPQDFTYQDLEVHLADVILVPPKTLTPDMAKHDFALFEYAMREAYGGRGAFEETGAWNSMNVLA